MNRKNLGRLSAAPEGFIPPDLVAAVTAHGVDDARRKFLHSSFAAAMLGSAGLSSYAKAAEGESVILEKRPWQTMLGQPVAATPYGVPSQYESNLQRRESPGLTRVSAASASVAFTPLQGLFGIITPNGLHFERHHQGWVDIDPARSEEHTSELQSPC